MDLFTLDRSFHKRDAIDAFTSAIWTERYYGNSDVELVVPATTEMFQKLRPGTFLHLDGADEVMILETAQIEAGSLKLNGISLLPWMNNRFVRTSSNQKDETWAISGGPAGWVPWAILWNMCHKDSPFLQAASMAMGISHPEKFAIPGLALVDYDKSGPNISVNVPYGPVYDAMREIATAYEIGMTLTLSSVTDTSFSLGFLSYKGLDRTSAQSVNPPVRFSPQMDSLTNIKELQSIAALKTLVYTFVPQIPDALKTTAPGSASLSSTEYTGFDLRALQVFVSDISTFTGTAAELLAILNTRAAVELENNPYYKAVDGEVVPTNQFKYGRDYNMGDLIEIQGNSGVVSKARVTEYIRAQDEAGEKAYPTVAMLE
jgi:Siphovirus ReqiPepy6 Gp37-like protein